MRITHSMMRNTYIKNYNNSLSALNKLSLQSTTFRKFDRTSEDVVGSTRALTIRDELSRFSTYKENLEESKGVLSAAETSITTINTISQQVYEKLVYGMNGPTGETGREVLADEIRTLATEIIKVANTDYAGKYVLGGSNNSEPPFTLDADGTLLFNGMNMDNAKSFADFPKNKDIFMDVGLGLTVDDFGNVDPSTVMTVSTSGVKSLGFGAYEDGTPKNIYNLCMKIADTLDSEDFNTDEAGKLLEHLKESQATSLLQITDIGDRCNFADFNIDRMDKNILALKDAQNLVESVDPAEVITDFKMQEYAYNTTLSMGTKLLQHSIFDFMR